MRMTAEQEQALCEEVQRDLEELGLVGGTRKEFSPPPLPMGRAWRDVQEAKRRFRKTARRLNLELQGRAPSPRRGEAQRGRGPTMSADRKRATSDPGMRCLMENLERASGVDPDGWTDDR